ncbi:hypothetical protein [Herbiconiux liangxiaofengii]|uniref:hypothetical protein n=1 Tax=Herbiconiux liangxiaofengii TaxID=3342795 RepID=UPI0035B8F3EC
MYIGHYAAAAVLVSVVPEASVAPAAIGVAWPDLLWSALVLLSQEKVTPSRDSPLQRTVRFDFYPFSHSLLLSNLLAVVPAVIIAFCLQNPMAGVVFWLGSVSHWILDLIVHEPDLPVTGFSAQGMKMGFGLWRLPKTAYVAEYAFFAVFILITAQPSMFAGLLGGGLLLHLLNANSAFAFTTRNPVGTPRRFAVVALVGFVGAIAWFCAAWQ